jgi:hypothetical protein
MSIKIQIFDQEKNDINPTFVRANAALLNSKLIRTNSELENAWLEEYRVTLNLDDHELIFDNETDMTMFLIRWG